MEQNSEAESPNGSRNSPPFLEIRGSLPCSQKLATCDPFLIQKRSDVFKALKNNIVV
jgi:hypothetical protein